MDGPLPVTGKRRGPLSRRPAVLLDPRFHRAKQTWGNLLFSRWANMDPTTWGHFRGFLGVFATYFLVHTTYYQSTTYWLLHTTYYYHHHFYYCCHYYNHYYYTTSTTSTTTAHSNHKKISYTNETENIRDSKNSLSSACD